MELRFSSFILSVIYSWLLATVVVVVAQSNSSASVSKSTTSSPGPSSIPAPPQQISFPSCGMSTMVSGIAGSGCGFTDAPCLCKAKTFKEAASNRLSKACPKQEEAQSYISFINAQCQGQPGYPITVKQTSFASMPLRPEIWSALGAAFLAAIRL